LRKFELVLDGITNESILYPDGTVKSSVRDIVPGQTLLLDVTNLADMGHSEAEHVRWLTEKAGYVEVWG